MQLTNCFPRGVFHFLCVNKAKVGGGTLEKTTPNSKKRGGKEVLVEREPEVTGEIGAKPAVKKPAIGTPIDFDCSFTEYHGSS